MAGVNYGHPNNTVRREAGAVAGGAATTQYAHNVTKQKRLLKAVHAVVRTAGTNSGHGLDIYVGTTSVGTIAIGTAAALTAFTTLLGTGNDPKGLTIASMDPIHVRTLVDAIGIVTLSYEFQNLPDAEFSE